MIKNLIDQYHYNLNNNKDLVIFFKNKEFYNLTAEELKTFLQESNVANNCHAVRSLFYTSLLNILSNEDLYDFIYNKDGSINLLLFSVFESNTNNVINIDIFNNPIFGRLDHISLSNLLNQLNEDSKGQSISLYIAEHGSANNLKDFFYNSIFGKLEQFDSGLVRKHLLLEDDNGDRILDIILKKEEHLKIFLNSPVFFNLKDADKSILFSEKGSSKISVSEYFSSNIEASKIVLNNNHISWMPSDIKIHLIKEIIKSPLTINNETLNMKKLELIIDTQSFKSLNCSEKLEFVTCEYINLLKTDDCFSNLYTECNITTEVS